MSGTISRHVAALSFSPCPPHRCYRRGSVRLPIGAFFRRGKQRFWHCVCPVTLIQRAM